MLGCPLRIWKEPLEVRPWSQFKLRSQINFGTSEDAAAGGEREAPPWQMPLAVCSWCCGSTGILEGANRRAINFLVCRCGLLRVRFWQRPIRAERYMPKRMVSSGCARTLLAFQPSHPHHISYLSCPQLLSFPLPPFSRSRLLSTCAERVHACTAWRVTVPWRPPSVHLQ
jgi:hypothetical protein